MEHEFVDNKKTVYEAFDYFKKRFLIDKKSIFSASDSEAAADPAPGSEPAITADPGEQLAD